jgi:hypothetical protein
LTDGEDFFASPVTFSAQSVVEGMEVKEDYGYDEILFSGKPRCPKVWNSSKTSLFLVSYELYEIDIHHFGPDFSARGGVQPVLR